MRRTRPQEIGIPCNYLEADICEPSTRKGLGKFDVITCQDVLEHVMDPTLMIQTVSSMLNRGGVVFVQVPNKWGAQQLLSDHHYALRKMLEVAFRGFEHLVPCLAVAHGCPIANVAPGRSP